MQDDSRYQKFESLREQAEELLKRQDVDTSGYPQDMLGLIEELKLHQAELEVQNQELKRSQEEVSALEQEYEELYEFAPCGYVTLDAKGIVTRINLTGVRLLNATRMGLYYSGLAQFLTQDSRSVFSRLLQESKQGQARAELELLQDQGSTIWVQAEAQAKLDQEGQVQQYLVILHDISQRKKVENRLQESEERFRAIVEGAPDAVFVQTEQRFAYLNPQALELFGARQESELLGQPTLDRVHSDFKEMGVDRMRRLNEERQPVLERFEVKFLRLDEKEVWVETTGQPITYQGKDGGLVFARDITERKELEQLKEDVERITRHDLKTPLHGILGIPQLLLEDDNLRQKQRDLLEHILASGYRMLDMINMSLSLYQMERGQYQLQPQPIDLLAILQDLQNDLESLLRAHKISLSWSMPGRAEEENFLVYAEKLLCYTMLSNLVNNAVEATPPGEKVLICLEEADADQVRISIHNPGVIPEEVQNRFGQRYVTAGKKQGAGLGVYSAHLIAETMQGSLSWHSTEQEGTWVKVTLPRPPDWMSKWAG